MHVLIRIAVLSLILSGCGNPELFTLETRSQHLIATATVSSQVSGFRNGGVKISGRVVVENQSSEPQPYSNSWLLLRDTDSGAYRAYLDNLSSNVVDTGTIDVPANGSMELSVYWVVPSPESGSVFDKPRYLEIDPDQ